MQLSRWGVLASVQSRKRGTYRSLLEIEVFSCFPYNGSVVARNLKRTMAVYCLGSVISDDIAAAYHIKTGFLAGHVVTTISQIEEKEGPAIRLPRRRLRPSHSLQTPTY